MRSLKNKIVLITGASSGIGKACAEQFAEKGAKLILTARRADRIRCLATTLQEKFSVECLPIPLDVQDKNQVRQVLETLPATWQKIDILVNNAGIALTLDKMQDAKVEHWETMLNTNVHGLLYVTRAILPGMIARNEGHIINMGSVASHQTYVGGNIYAASKSAVHAISQSLRFDLMGTKIRVTHISPGAVETEFSEVRFDDKVRAKKFYQDFSPLSADDIADTVIYAATRPLHVNVSEIVIFPTDQAASHAITRSGGSS